MLVVHVCLGWSSPARKKSVYGPRLEWAIVSNIRPEKLMKMLELSNLWNQEKIGELPYLDKGVWKTEQNPVRQGVGLWKPTYVT